MICEHEVGLKPVAARTPGCEECLKAGTRWVHLAALGQCIKAVLKRCRAGEKLFEAGERDGKFFVVKSGEVEIVDESGEAPRTVTVHRAGEFTGDVAQVTGGPVLVSAVARTD